MKTIVCRIYLLFFLNLHVLVVFSSHSIAGVFILMADILMHHSAFKRSCQYSAITRNGGNCASPLTKLSEKVDHQMSGEEKVNRPDRDSNTSVML